MRTFIVCTILFFSSLSIGCSGWAYKVPTMNMVPTIQVGDTCIVNKFEYSSKRIQRFDIVAFKISDDVKKLTGETGDIRYIKRIIGLPNEKLKIENNKIYINGNLLDEPFEKIVDSKDLKKDFAEILIPENEYFLLGDNRPNSLDGRYWKKPTVEKEAILGKVVEIIPAKE